MPLGRLFRRESGAQRLLSLDVLRGVAIVLMVIFHFGYDLSAFGYAHYDTAIDTEWRVFRAVIVSGFLLAVGMSSYLAYARQINWHKLMLNITKLALVAVFISLSSYLMYPRNWVYFGIIHFIALAVPLSLIFVRKPTLALWLGLGLIVGYFTELLSMQGLWLWSVEHWHIPRHSVDLVSLVPWFGVVLLGVFIMHHQYLPQIKSNRLSRALAFLGRHSLVIYLLHQPILYSGFYLFSLLFAKDC